MQSMNKKPKHFQYATRMIFLGIVFVPLIPYLMALAITYAFFVDSLSRSSHNTMERLVQQQAQRIEAYLDERKSDLTFILDNFTEEELVRPGTLQRLLASMQKEGKYFTDLGVINARGEHVAYAGPHQLLDKNYLDQEWFIETHKYGEYVSDVFLGFRNVPHFVVTKTGKGEHPLILRATVDTDTFSKFVGSVRVGQTGEVFLLNDEGQHQTQREGRWNLLETASGIKEYLSPVAGVNSYVRKTDGDQKFLSAVTSVNQGRWRLVAQQEAGDAFRDVYTAVGYIITVSIIGGIVTLSLAQYFSNRISSTLSEKEDEKSLLRDRLYRSVRLAELGEMTASFAHEINNPLQIMKSELTMLDILLEDAEKENAPLTGTLKNEVRDSLEQIELQINRCSEITMSILRFGRKEPATATTINLANLLPEIAAMVAKKAETRGIDFRCEVKPETPTILGDASKLQQIFINLLNNAIYAIVDRHGNRGGLLEFIAESGGQGWALIKVKDNGTGIPREVLSSIYTPFFTTKPPEKGTGLGLSVCYGLVESMGGAIDVSTRVGEGTVFSVMLPTA